MGKHYAWLWFDADGTLFDFHAAEGIALKNAFQSVGVSYEDRHLDVYRGINGQLWQALERREITQDVLQVRRFELLVDAAQLGCSANQMGAAFVEHLGACAEMIDGAHEVVAALAEHSRVAIVTNGLKAVQRNRLALSPIREYVEALIISEEVGAAKPKAAFFEAAFRQTGHPDKGDVLIIGDSLSADIQGGADYGIDTCWYNPAGVERPGELAITYEIAALRELLDVLD